MFLYFLFFVVIVFVFVFFLFFYFYLIFCSCCCWYFVFFSSVFNYTFYKNPGFWFVNSRCIFRVISYLGLISFIFTAAGVFAWGFNFYSPCAVVFAKTYFTCLPSRASSPQILSEYFLFTILRKVSWLIKFETLKCSDVNVKQ